jgi:hypothetical protein
VFRKDFHTFSYQEQENNEILIVFTKKSENTPNNYLVVLKLKSLSELRKRLSISLVAIPSEKTVLDLALSPSNSIVLVTASESWRRASLDLRGADTRHGRASVDRASDD